MEVQSTNTRRELVLFVVMVLLSLQLPMTACIMDCSHITPQATLRTTESRIVQSVYHDDDGPSILCDWFNQSPIGLNTTVWDISTFSNPTISWEDNEYLMLEGKMFVYTTLTSRTQTAPAVIADFNISFSQGKCYFGIGWSDSQPTAGNEYVTNLRLSTNGVFIDCWEGSLFLACFSEGRRAAIPLSGLDLTEFHNFRLSWCESLVKLEIDGALAGFLTTSIPSCELPFVVTISGHDNLAGVSRLRLDHIRVLERVRPARPDDPEILLLWPENDSWVYQSDSIDFEVENSDGVLRYQWDTNNECAVERPWDVPVPDEEGNHTLTVWSTTTEGHIQSKSLSFTVFNQSLHAEAPVTDLRPNIDGCIDHSEEIAASTVHIEYSLANRTRIESVLFVAFYEDSLYVGVRTPVQDGKHTRIALQIDGNSDGVWVDSLGNCSDLAVVATSPTCDTDYSGIFSPGGREISPQEVPGIVVATALTGDLVSAEFRVPLGTLSGNSTRGIGLRIVVSHAGYDCVFPDLGGEDGFLVVTGAIVPTSPLPLLIAVLLLGPIAVVGIAYTVRKLPRRNPLPVAARLQDETAERIRTLVESYEDITIPRLSKMANITESQVIHTLRELEKAGLLGTDWLRSHLGQSEHSEGESESRNSTGAST